MGAAILAIPGVPSLPSIGESGRRCYNTLMRTACLAILLLGSSCVYAQSQPSPPQVPPRPRTVVIMAGAPPRGRSIAVLQPDNRLAQYDSQFHNWRIMPMPPGAHDHPENIAISRSGTVLYRQPQQGEGLTHFWCSDPHFPTITAGAYEKRPADGGGFLITSADPQVSFSSDGGRLYWFETRQVRRTSDEGGEQAQQASFLSWSSGLDGASPSKLAEFAFPRCVCETGACEETCPEAQVWTPSSGVSDFFFLTRWIPGQTQATYQQTDLYQQIGGKWAAHAEPSPVETILDAADHGNLFLEAVSDGGCCGWENEGDDAAYFTRNGGAVQFFDERKRFHNDNYDVSFLVSGAAISPDATRIAYTVAATQKAGEEIRVSDSGKANPEELARIRKLLPEMPRAEVVLLTAPNTVAFSVPHAEVVGWLDERRVLAVVSGEVVALDSASGQPTPTGIKAEAAKFVFLQ